MGARMEAQIIAHDVFVSGVCHAGCRVPRVHRLMDRWVDR